MAAAPSSVRQVPLLDDDTVEFGDEDNVKGRFKHPYVTFFHLAFRGAALVVYLLCGLFSNSFIASFIFIVFLHSLDFWTVKNVTGRLMVGLRWWNYIDDNGESHWVFESRKGRVDPGEVRVFWIALVAFPVLWALLFIVALFGFKFRWLLLVCIGLTLTGANLYGYVKCKVGGNKDVTFSGLTNNFMKQQVLQNVVGMMSRSPPQSGQNTNII
ncbi:uncharacterized Golgi apparatus membrane protein-like protein CG5021 isoform X2 [Cloeon dipterum]|uniref:uncharacterized Golgi apparatus membrane protein-like protein CG5021 isoform X2 n=1 Tax=Cloeon dipterum TaxID=197152 RepID=UPI00321F71B8